jgi:hypothetical protein
LAPEKVYTEDVMASTTRPRASSTPTQEKKITPSGRGRLILPEEVKTNRDDQKADRSEGRRREAKGFGAERTGPTAGNSERGGPPTPRSSAGQAGPIQPIGSGSRPGPDWCGQRRSRSASWPEQQGTAQEGSQDNEEPMMPTMPAQPVSRSQLRGMRGADARKIDRVLAQPGQGVALYTSGDTMTVSFGNRFDDIGTRFAPSAYGDFVLRAFCPPEGTLLAEQGISPALRNREVIPQIAAHPVRRR